MSDPAANVDECIAQCLACHRACLETMAYSLRQGGELALPEHVRVLADCAQICQATADFMIRGSDLAGPLHAACAAVCLACAESCDGFPHEPPLESCAVLCRTCAETCAAMSD